MIIATRRYSTFTATAWIGVCALAFCAMAQVAAVPDVDDDAPDAPVSLIESGVGMRVLPKRLKDYDLPGFENKVYLQTLQPWKVTELVEFLAVQAGVKNIVIGQGVAEMTTKLTFDGVSAGDALEVVLSSSNLAYEMRGGILAIMTDEEYKAMHGSGFYDQKQVAVVGLRYADPDKVGAMLNELKSDIGTIVADPVAGKLILIDTPEKIREMESVIAGADIETITRVLPTETKTFALQHAELADIEAELDKLLSKEAGSVQTDSRTKTLIVTELPHTMRKIEQMMKVFDRRPRQVFIEAKIIETVLSEGFSMGINWNNLFEGLDPRFALQSVVSPGSPTTPAGTLSYQTITDGGDLSVVLEALETVGEVKVLSNAQVGVLDGNEASIEVITEQPYKETTIESGTTNVTGVTYLFVPVGVQLAVTPRINDEDRISVGIKPTISSIAEWYDGAPQEGTPVVKKSVAETTVMVRDGMTIIIGGMIQDRKEVSTSRVPVLGSLPLIGRLFRYDVEDVENTETVLFMTPRIYTGDEPIKRTRDIKKEPKPMRAVGSAKPLKAVR